jgi:hypothetical protein
MIQELKVDVQGSEIAIVIRGTCLRMACRKGDAPWLVCVEHGPDDPDARVTLTEFRALAWTAANAKARELGWIAYKQREWAETAEAHLRIVIQSSRALAP